MMKYAFILVILLSSIPSYGSGNKNIKYVWAINGLNMRSTPSIKGKIIKQLPYGDSVLVSTETYPAQEDLFLDSLYPEIHPIRLNGKWVKIKSGQKDGYVFDAYLLDIPCAQEGEDLNNYAIRMAHKYTSSVIKDSFPTFYGDNFGLMTFNTSICNIPDGFQISYFTPSMNLVPYKESQVNERNEGASESFYFKGFSLQELLVFISPFYMTKTENQFKVFERGEKNIRLTDDSTQTIDMWFFEDDIIIFLFEDAGC